MWAKAKPNTFAPAGHMTAEQMGSLIEKSKILLIEDSASDAALFQKYLSKSRDGSKYEVVVARTLGEGLGILQHQTVDIVVADLSLPDSSGLNTVEEIRRHRPLLTLVVLTGLKDEEVGLTAVQCGAQDYLVKGTFDREELARALKFAVERQRTVSAIQMQNATFDYAADRDFLTDLPNRKLFRDRIDQALASSKRSQKGLGIAILDVDGLKAINEAFSEKVGDLLLRGVAERLQKTLRSSDSLARIGGDEFAVLLTDLKSGHDMRLVARKLIKALQEPYLVNSYRLFIRVSFGISVYPDDSDSTDELLQQADAALAQAKKSGGNRFRFNSPRLMALEMSLTDQEKALENALERSELEVHFEPQIDLRNQKLFGVHAMLQWKNPEWGMIPAHQFSIFSEPSTILKKANQFMIREAGRQLQIWRSKGFDLKLAMNLLGPQALRNDSLQLILPAIKEFGLAPENICLEISETDIPSPSDRTVSILKGLRDTGMQLVLKSLGSDSTTIGKIKELPLNGVKLGGALISDLSRNKSSMGVVKALIDVAHGFGLRSMAEGIDTLDQQRLLIKLGCQQAQGFFIGGVAPAEVLSRNYNL